MISQLFLSCLIPFWKVLFIASGILKGGVVPWSTSVKYRYNYLMDCHDIWYRICKFPRELIERILVIPWQQVKSFSHPVKHLYTWLCWMFDLFSGHLIDIQAPKSTNCKNIVLLTFQLCARITYLGLYQSKCTTNDSRLAHAIRMTAGEHELRW